jgi:hypothetical protein
MFSAAGKTAAVATAANYIEDVFSTWLYTGNGSTQTITNGIDLSTKGGLVWIKARNGAGNHRLFDTARGLGSTGLLISNLENAAGSSSNSLNSFNSDGFTTGVNLNSSGDTLATWTFRKQPKFFDVVTYTGTGSARTVSHSLGSIPGCIIIKCINSDPNWAVYHRSTGNTQYLILNTTAAAATSSAWWNNTTPTATEFTVGTDASVNANGSTYVAYLFAHDAGGFGLTGTDNVISCGSYTGNGDPDSGPSITLGYEPQWLLIKEASGGTGNWSIWDNMRGLNANQDVNTPALYPNTSDAETSLAAVNIRATGFFVNDNNALVNRLNSTYIYIAIRRGPMKTPTTGTSVFAVQNGRAATNGTASANAFTSGWPVDLMLQGYTDGDSSNALAVDRMRGGTLRLSTSSTNAEASTVFGLDDMDGVYLTVSTSTFPAVGWMFRRAPGFFDVVCYTGNGTYGATNHNLGVIPV